MDEIAVSAEMMVPALPEADIEAVVAAAVDDVALSEVAAEVIDQHPVKKRIHRAKALTPKQAVTKFWSRGIYVIPNEDLDIDASLTNEEVQSSRYILRCKCSPGCKTSFASWDAYAYNRHFTYKKHVKWEQNRLGLGWDESEAYQEFVKFIEMTLDDEDDVEEERPKKRGRKPKNSRKSKAKAKSLKTAVNPRSEERRQREMHYMTLWRKAREELKTMRQQLKEETIQESIEELNEDIAGLRKKKDEWAKFLGIEGSDTLV